MATFVIIPTESTTDFDTILSSKFKNQALKLPMGEWLVAYEGTSSQLSDEIGITEKATSPAIVLNYSAYWGRASQDIWEWIEQNGAN